MAKDLRISFLLDFYGDMLTDTPVSYTHLDVYKRQDEGFVKGLAQLCREKDVLLLIDEVQTGIGRTGRFFAYQGYGVQPDVVTCAKGIAGGLPMGACLVSERLGDILQPGQNGSTFWGNPIASAAARVVAVSYTHLGPPHRQGPG